MTAPAAPMSRREKKRRQRPRTTVTGVIGELLLTAGVIVLLFVAWQMWIGDIIISAQQNEQGQQISQEWDRQPAPGPPPAVETEDGVWYEPPLMEHPSAGEHMALLRVPRFGDDYAATIAGGTTRPITLDNGWVGVYDQSVMPGQVGNFSVAGHRTTWGFPLNRMDKLKIDDAIVVETAEGWYTYRYRNMQYVTPDAVDVLLDVPQVPGVETGERYMTLTACSPLYSLAERIVGYAVFEGFQPRSEGAPESLAPVDVVAGPSW